MSKQGKIIKKMGIQKVFLINELKQVVMKSVPGTPMDFYIKNMNGEENRIQSNEKIILDTLLIAREISEKEYADFGKLEMKF